MLRHLSSALDARLLFATHYFGLTAEFAGDARVANGHMAALVGGDAGYAGTRGSPGSPSRVSSRRDADKLQTLGLGSPSGAAPWASPRRSAAEGVGAAYDEAQITFLYRLRPGACPRSYGLQVRPLTCWGAACRLCLLLVRVFRHITWSPEPCFLGLLPYTMRRFVRCEVSGVPSSWQCSAECQKMEDVAHHEICHLEARWQAAQVARLAGIPASVVAGASEAGARMEAKLEVRLLTSASTRIQPWAFFYRNSETPHIAFCSDGKARNMLRAWRSAEFAQHYGRV